MKREQIFRNTRVKQYGLPFVEGSLAGLIATVPMTIFMLAVQYLLPHWQQYALPPERLTDTFVRWLGLKKHMGKPQLLGASFVSHLGFGAAMGAIYGPLTRIVPLPSVLKGMVFGSVVWLTVYLGWLPAVGMSEAATKQPIQRNALMITAHLVWGAGMGGVMTLLEGVFDRLIGGSLLKKAS
jgi:uncharacterized membrane protein YagU involved in acid resistance